MKITFYQLESGKFASETTKLTELRRWVKGRHEEKSEITTLNDRRKSHTQAAVSLAAYAISNRKCLRPRTWCLWFLKGSTVACRKQRKGISLNNIRSLEVKRRSTEANVRKRTANGPNGLSGLHQDFYDSEAICAGVSKEAPEPLDGRHRLLPKEEMHFTTVFLSRHHFPSKCQPHSFHALGGLKVQGRIEYKKHERNLHLSRSQLQSSPDNGIILNTTISRRQEQQKFLSKKLKLKR
ncbi:hypothetical protein CEXT_670131 [Caerostris extrusa]|uniref:Uncharacterized protein n=1 Tax=Caerostris extrusa TaxID=172846 RepID=A0AAV4UJ28_CAEEX|nr:hypothetical protein CEXT_670131 [Caerostris extrusa]